MKLKTTQKGLAIVEAAIILPVLLLVMFAIMEVGIILYDKAVITNASREAARSGIALKNPRLTTAEIQTVATNYCTLHLVNFTPAGLTVTATTLADAFGIRLQVAVAYNYPSLVLGNLINLFPGDPFPDPLVLPATTTMYME